MSETESLTLPKVAEDLKPAPYNPRSITRVALKKLAQSLNEYGDLSGIVFNARTGCLVGAHQRLRVLPDGAQIHYGSDRPDDRGEVWGSIRAKGQTFSVRVVDWDLDKEKKANIIANNPALQGSYDADALADLLGNGIDFSDVGFELTDMEYAGFTSDQLSDILGRPGVQDDALEPEPVQRALGRLAEMAQAGEDVPKKERGHCKDALISNVRRDQTAGQDEHNYYRTIVFRSDEEAEEFMSALNYDRRERFVDGPHLMRMLSAMTGPKSI